MDIYDGADWTEMDIEDLKAAIETGRSIEEAAQFLCRADSVDDVARKCGIEAEGPILTPKLKSTKKRRANSSALCLGRAT
jgi:hypothetical protein